MNKNKFSTYPLNLHFNCCVPVNNLKKEDCFYYIQNNAIVIKLLDKKNKLHFYYKVFFFFILKIYFKKMKTLGRYNDIYVKKYNKIQF